MEYLHANHEDLGEVPLKNTTPAPAKQTGSLRGLRRPYFDQRVMRIVRPFYRAKLKRNIRAWLPAAVKDPRSVEADFVARWSYELNFTFGL